VVNNPLPVAVDDNATVNYFATGNAVNAVNVLTNDLYNGAAVVPSQFTITQLTNLSNSGIGFNTSTGQVTVAPGTPAGTYTFTYQISLNAAPANVDVATVTVNVLQADLAITKTVTPGTVVAGQSVSYTITVKNNGPTDAQAVSVADALSSNLTNITTTPSVGTWTAPNWTIGTLLNGASATLTVNAKVLASYSGTLANTATVTGTLTLSATASSGLTVAFASTTATICTVSGTTAILLSSGTCSIQATQAGNGSYAAAPPVTRSFTVNHETQTITLPTIPTTTLITGTVTEVATASSGLPVTLVSTTPLVCSASGTTVTLIAVGTCGIEASAAGNSDYLAAPNVFVYFSITH